VQGGIEILEHLVHFAASSLNICHSERSENRGAAERSRRTAIGARNLLSDSGTSTPVAKRRLRSG
jgi:hypothetical protein